MLSDPVPPLTLLSAPVPVNVKLSPPVPAVRLLMPVYVNAMPPVTEPPFTVLMAQAFAAASCATRLSVPPPVRVLNPLNVRVCPPFTRVFDAPPTFQVAALPMPFCSVPLALLVMLSMLVKFAGPTVEVPPNPFAPDAVRFTVAAAARPLVSMLSDPVPPLTLLSAPVPVNVKLSPPVPAVRLLMPVYVNAMPPVTEPPFTVLMAQAFAAASCATRLSVPPPVRVLNPLNVRVCPPFTRVFDAPPTFQVAALPMPFCSVPLALLVMLSMLVKFAGPTVEVPPNPFAPDAVRFTVAAAARPLVSMLSDPVPPLTLLSAPVPVNVKLSPPVPAVRLLMPVYVNAMPPVTE